MKVLVVDDSVVFRSQIKSALKDHKEFEEIDVAANGKIAISKMKQSDYTLTILDLEMPEMNGIETLKAMKAEGLRSKVIVFSSLSARGANSTMEALDNGACDFVTKPQDINSFELALDHIREQLIPKALQFTGHGSSIPVKVAVNAGLAQPEPLIRTEPKSKWKTYTVAHFIPKVCVIGCSTGGPVALKDLFALIKGPLKHPILITQHMPPVFTKTLAKSIEEQTGIPTKEAKHYEELKNQIYVAPGDFHLSLKKSDDKIFTVLDKREKRNSVRPAVDHLFESASEVFGANTLGVILTGMGSDGADGSVAVKEKGGCILIQDEKSSVVWGMPGAVHKLGSFDQMASIQECCKLVSKLIGRPSL